MEGRDIAAGRMEEDWRAASVQKSFTFSRTIDIPRSSDALSSSTRDLNISGP